MNLDHITTELQNKVKKIRWKHGFEIVPGLIVNGDFGFIDSKKLLSETYGLPEDLTGLSALDIGALDGVHTFELERRGAKVTAIDIQSPDKTGFNTVKEIRGSKAEYIQGNVYDLKALLSQKFDIILYFGVWYHLKNPVMAMEQIGSVLKDDGLLLGEGEALIEYTERDGRPLDTPEDRRFAASLAASELPISVYYPAAMKGDEWNWYVPNLACVKAWMETAQIEYISHTWWNDFPHQRLHVKGRKNQKIKSRVDNPVW